MMGGESPEVALQAAEFFFTNRWRLYVRSTIPTAPTDAEETSADDDPVDAQAAAIDQSVKNTLLDPYGGTANIAVGYFRKIPTPFLVGEANDAEHGMFVDGRLGVRFTNLPEETLTLEDGKGRFTPFISSSAALRLILPIFFDPSLAERAGGVELAVGYLVNHAPNRSSRLFRADAALPPVLKATTHSGFFSVAVALTRIANLSVTGTWKSNVEFDRRVVFALTLVKSNDPAKEAGRPH